MLEVELKIINQLGLHARAAAQLVKLSSRFESTVKLRKLNGQNEADAKSILSILTLAASHGTMVRLRIDGDDEENARIEIEELFRSGFGEL